MRVGLRPLRDRHETTREGEHDNSVSQLVSTCKAERGRDTASPLALVSVPVKCMYVHALGQRRATAQNPGVGFIFYFLNTCCAQTRQKPSREEREREEERGTRRQGGRGKPSLEATGVLDRVRYERFRRHLRASDTDEPQEWARAGHDVVEMVEEAGRSRPLVECGRHNHLLRSEPRVARPLEEVPSCHAYLVCACWRVPIPTRRTRVPTKTLSPVVSLARERTLVWRHRLCPLYRLAEMAPPTKYRQVPRCSWE